MTKEAMKEYQKNYYKERKELKKLNMNYHRYKITDIKLIRFDFLYSSMIIGGINLTKLSEQMGYTKQMISAWFKCHNKLTLHKTDLYYMLHVISKNPNADKIIAIYRTLCEEDFKDNISAIPISLDKLSWDEFKRIVDEEL